MNEKRFENRLNEENIKFNAQNLICDNNPENNIIVFEMMELLNNLHEENQCLKKTLWEAEVNYYGERCDNILDYEGWIEDLKQEFERRYWFDQRFP